MVCGDRIVQAGPRGAAPGGSEQDETVIDLGEAAVVPGLIDAHLHLFGFSPSSAGAQMAAPDAYRVLVAASDLRRLAAAGFTTVRCMGSPLGPILGRAVEEGIVEGPRIVAAGEYICQRGGTWDPVGYPLAWADRLGMFADGPEQCRRRVRERIRSGAGVIKIGVSSGRALRDRIHPWADGPDGSCPNYSVEEIQVMVEEAHRMGLRVAAHAIGDLAVRNAVLGGVDTVEHGHGASAATYRMMADRGVMLVPTLSLPYRRSRFGLQGGLPQWAVDVWRRHLEQQMQCVATALACGVAIAVGTDFVGPPLTPFGDNALEFRLLVEAGMRAWDALAAGTVVGARALGLEAAIGTIEPGQLADIVAVQGRPWEDPEALMRVVFVMKGGKVVRHEAATWLPEAP